MTVKELRALIKGMPGHALIGLAVDDDTDELVPDNVDFDLTGFSVVKGRLYVDIRFVECPNGEV